jgi:hypothetical protein
LPTSTPALLRSRLIRKTPPSDPRSPAGGLQRVLHGAGAAPVAVATPRGALRPYLRALLPDGHQVLRKAVRPEHELRTPPGVAVDEDVLAAAERAGFSGIVIERVSTSEVLFAPLSRWRTGVKISRGFGRQRALLWRDLEPVRADEAPSAAAPIGEQVSLFEK